jgi:hypothetical protein
LENDGKNEAENGTDAENGTAAENGTDAEKGNAAESGHDGENGHDAERASGKSQKGESAMADGEILTHVFWEQSGEHHTLGSLNVYGAFLFWLFCAASGIATGRYTSGSGTSAGDDHCPLHWV